MLARTALLSVIGTMALTGCGGGQAGSAVHYGHGDTATFVIDGRSIRVTEAGRASVKVQGAPEIGHNGPVGCTGRYFTADFLPGVPMFFRYGSQDAYLLVGSDLYYLGGAPDRTPGTLTWSTSDSGHTIQIRAKCTPPPSTGPLTGAQTPPACGVLTRAVAQAALQEKVGPPKFVQENPDLSYCAYTTLDTSFDRERRVSAYIATAAEIVQLSSWAAPRITGLGDAARGGPGADALAVRQGKLGLELAVDLGSNASDAQRFAAEEALARVLLARLPGA